MDMGYADLGGGPPVPMTGGTPVSDLTGPSTGTPDVSVTLVARQETFRLASGERVDGYTLNGRSPGPVIRATQGELVQVTLVNESVADGVTLHWHGVDVPNAEDGVAGRHPGRGAGRADATSTGSSPTGRRHLLVPLAPGVARAGRAAGCSGRSSSSPRRRPPPASTSRRRRCTPTTGRRTVNGADRATTASTPRRAARPGAGRSTPTTAPLRVWSSAAPYRRASRSTVTTCTDPTDVDGTSVVVAAGGRVDLEVRTPADGRRAVELGGGAAAGRRPGGGRRAATRRSRTATLDLLTYGTPAPLGFDPAHAGPALRRTRIGRRLGLPRRQARAVVDDQRPPVPGRPDVRWSARATSCG